MESRLEIFTLGGVRILQSGQPVADLSNRKAIALLIYLASTRRPQPREVLADLLWDERTQSQALAYLRVALNALHKTLGDSLLSGRELIALNPAVPLWLDTLQLEDSLREVHRQGKVDANTVNQVADTLALYGGDFLEGFSLSDCRRFEDWQRRERERLHQLAVDGLYELVAYQIERREYQLGIEHTARLLELDPLMEAGHRQMMLLLAGCGQRAAALAQYETCRKLLHEELGLEPDMETVALYNQIRGGKPVTEAEEGLLPSGTVTFMYSQIEGSGHLLEQLREGYTAVLAEQRQLLRGAFQRWNGREIDLQGDAFFVAFERAADAVACAIEAQSVLFQHTWPGGHGHPYR
jgi:DNA-binding SARP family transcriptional activator